MKKMFLVFATSLLTTISMYAQQPPPPPDSADEKNIQIFQATTIEANWERAAIRMSTKDRLQLNKTTLKRPIVFDTDTQSHWFFDKRNFCWRPIPAKSIQ